MDPNSEEVPQSDQEASGESPAPQEPIYDDQAAYPAPEMPSGIYDDLGAAPVDQNQAAPVDPNPQVADPGQAFTDPGVTPPPGASQSAGIYDDAPPPPPALAQAPAATPATPVRRSVAKKAVVKKKMTRRTRGPAVKTAGASKAYKRPAPSYGGGGMMNVFLLLVGLGMLAVAVMVMLPKGLSSVSGYPAESLNNTAPKNLLAEVQQVMISRNSEIGFSEEEVNQYLNHRLQGDQTGVMGAMVTFKAIYIDLVEGGFEVIVEREFFGMPITMSSEFEVKRFRHQVQYLPKGWTIGRLNFGSRNIKPIVEMFSRMKASCQEEMFTMQQLMDIRFEDNRIVFDAAI